MKSYDVNNRGDLYIGYKDNEGSKLYLNNESSTTRQLIFTFLFQRDWAYYVHTGSDIFSDNPWKKIDGDAIIMIPGLGIGDTITEYDEVFSTKILDIRDQYTSFDKFIQEIGTLCFLIYGCDILSYAGASLNVASYYIKNYGIVNGIQYAYYIGASELPNGFISYVQQESDSTALVPSSSNLPALSKQYMMEYNAGYYIIPYAMNIGEYLQNFEEIYLYDNVLVVNPIEGAGKVTVKYGDEAVSVYRGGSDFTIKAGEIKIDKATGMVTSTHGVSLDVNPNTVSKFGGAYKIDSLPDGLQIIQRGSRAEHFEIVPTKPMTVDEFQGLLNQITTSPVK